MTSKGLQFIRLPGGGVVLKRGVNELLLKGPGVASIVEPLVGMLDGGRTRQQLVEAFAAPLQPEVEKLLTNLLDRRLVSEGPEPAEDPSGAEALQAAFWWNFGDPAVQTPARLRQAEVVVVGANLIARSLVRSLLEMGIGRVTLVDHPILNNHLVPFDEAPCRSAGEERWRRHEQLPSEDVLGGAALLCAVSDFGQPDALLEINRIALRLKKPYLPVWLADLLGYVGPLNYPFETACLRCYRIRADSNNPDYEAARAVATHVCADGQARWATGLVPPLTGILGEIAALEVAKCVGGFAPSDVAGRVIEVNLVSFAASVRRVLKIPRCPDCSTLMQYGAKTLTVGAQIPYPDGRA